MAKTKAKKTATEIGLNVGTPRRKLGIVRPSISKDARPEESKYNYYARKYMEARAANTNARVQSEIDEVTRRMIDVEQKLLAAENANEDVTSLKEALASLQSERKAKKESLVFRPMRKSLTESDQ